MNSLDCLENDHALRRGRHPKGNHVRSLMTVAYLASKGSQENALKAWCVRYAFFTSQSSRWGRPAGDLPNGRTGEPPAGLEPATC